MLDDRGKRIPSGLANAWFLFSHVAERVGFQTVDWTLRQAGITDEGSDAPIYYVTCLCKRTGFHTNDMPCRIPLDMCDWRPEGEMIVGFHAATDMMRATYRILTGEDID